MSAGELSGVTSGFCLGYLQANLAILPAEAAGQFRDFCLANPRPLPRIDVTEPSDPTPRRVAPGADLRTDLPRYRVYHHGEPVAEVTDITELWRFNYYNQDRPHRSIGLQAPFPKPPGQGG